MRAIDADDLKTAFPACDNSKPVLIASVRATINHMPTIEPEQKWIPCSERLPSENESFYVLCCDTHGEVMIGHAFACDDGETPYSAESETEYMYDCVAWMPLPEPYREVSE